MSADETPILIDLAREARFTLGSLHLCPSTRELVAGERREVLEPRIMQVLVALARRRGEVVSRGELVWACWGGRAVSEDAINRSISVIRRLADAHGGFQIETVARVGYRLGEVDAPSAAPASPSSEPEILGNLPLAARQAEPLLAVLAFDNLSGDPDMTYFSDGVSEEIQEAVARGSALKVIGKASSFQFRGADKAAANVATKLDATHVLDGSVRRSGDRVRISAQLVECAKATTLWSERFDRDLTDIFGLQDEIAAEVAAALKTAFAPTGVAGSIDPGAYDLYLKARDEAALLGQAERVEMLERVVALAPGFALAWVELASWRFELAQRERGRLAFAPGLDAVRAALDFAERLDPTLGVTRFWRALLEPYAAYARREALCREALRLTPGDAKCLAGMGRFLGYVGRRREAFALADEAAARDPLSPAHEIPCLWLSDADYQTRMARYDALRVRWPAEFGGITFGVFAAWLATGAGDWPKYEALARHARARPFPEAEARLMRETFEFCEALRDGDNAYFDRLVGGMEASLARTGTVRLDTAARTAQAGRIEETFAALARASFDAAFEPGGGVGGGLLGGWGAGMIFDMLLNGAMIRDPRFLRLCAKLGLVSYWLDSGSWPDCADAVPYDFRAEARRLVGAHA